jgi:hypothetical protein
MSNFQDMPNPYALNSDPLPWIRSTALPVMVAETRPVQPYWCLQPEYEPRSEFVSAHEVLQGRFPNYSPHNLKQEHDFCLRILVSEKPEVPDFDFGRW